eukprot:gb/GECH01013389.1/.p1 GENE.gb/GECH01013389.1/~~gb/GECH01013389.1/.p1  ORF type:complete len:415 (+),score=75.68 gb/GECH01013389.1/:1-1245(+)
MNSLTPLIFCLLIVLFTSYSHSQSIDCPTAPSSPQDRREDISRLRVATFNTYFLFDGKDDPNPVPWSSSQQAMEHQDKIANVIKQLDADIIVLEETESCNVVTSMLNQTSLSNQYRVYMVRGTDYYTGQNVALVTRLDPASNLYRTSDRANYPVTGSKCGFDGNDDTGVSKHFFTTFNVPLPSNREGEKQKYLPLMMTGMHLRAIPTMPSSCAQREGQATVIRRELEHNLDRYRNGTLPGIDYKALKTKNDETDEKYPPLAVIALGDLNDYDNSVKDINDNEPTSKALRLIREFNEKSKLINVATMMSQENRFSSWYDRNDNNKIDEGDNELSLIDHVLVSNSSKEIISQVDIRSDLYWNNKSISDHWPIVVDFEFNSESESLSDTASNSCNLYINLFTIISASVFQVFWVFIV